MSKQDTWLTTTATPEETERLACVVACSLRLPLVLGLSGTLGAGKTCFVRGLAKAWGGTGEEVTSPTFTLWQTYETSPAIHHLDVYRLLSEDEFLELGVEDCMDGPDLIVVEWADKYASVFPDDTLWVDVQIEESGERVWRVRGGGENGRMSVMALRPD